MRTDSWRDRFNRFSREKESENKRACSVDVMQCAVTLDRKGRSARKSYEMRSLRTS